MRSILTTVARTHAHYLFAFERKPEGEEKLVQHLYEHLEGRIIWEAIPDAEDEPGTKVNEHDLL